MLIIGLLCFGVLVGWIAYGIVRLIFKTDKVSWGRTIVVGLLGSFVGGLIGSIIWGDGIVDWHPSGLIGSVIGAIILVIGDQFILARLQKD